jgi:LmbE family N-acetylglucosaminyl deacetylase
VSVLVVSTHLDDAVLSVGGRVDADTIVVTVFAGLPPTDLDVPRWDRLTGATNVHDRQVARLAEDDAALAVVGARPVRLPLLDGQYRDSAADIGRIAEELPPASEDVREIWVPAAIGGHPDHVAARDGALTAYGDAGLPIHLYADVPYSIAYGWPRWVTGRAGSPYVDADAWLADELTAVDLDAARLTPAVHRLDDEALARKKRAIACYATQLPVLDDACGRRLSDDDTLRFEVSWLVASHG